MRCPVCRKEQGYYRWPAVEPGDPDDLFPYSLYQRGYVKDPQEGLITCYPETKTTFISPRCSKCYEKAEKAFLKEVDK